MAKFNKGWNEDDSQAVFGPKQADRSGADYGRRTNQPPTASNGPGAVGFGDPETYGPLLGKPKNIPTPGLDSDPAQLCPKQPSRGNVGFSSDDFGILGKPQRPGRA